MARVVVEPKGVYGRELFYPVSDAALKFAALLQCRSFTRSQLEQVKGLGFEIVVLVPAVTI
jgi:hypothetical protein